MSSDIPFCLTEWYLQNGVLLEPSREAENSPNAILHPLFCYLWPCRSLFSFHSSGGRTSMQGQDVRPSDLRTYGHTLYGRTGKQSMDVRPSQKEGNSSVWTAVWSCLRIVYLSMKASSVGFIAFSEAIEKSKWKWKRPYNSIGFPWWRSQCCAERQRFELWEQLPVHRISSAARSTTPASFLVWRRCKGNTFPENDE